MAVDRTGLVVQAATPEAQDAVRSSVPSDFHEFVVFDSDGTLLAGPLLNAAEGQDPQSNVVRLAALAAHEETVEVMVIASDEVFESTIHSGKGTSITLRTSFDEIDEARTSGVTLGTTQPGRFFDGITDKASNTLFSPSENTRVMINHCHPIDIHPTAGIGSTMAHEFVHVQLLWLHAAGKVDKWRHSVPVNPVMENLMEQTEWEAIK